MNKELMIGNAAVARGLYEAGCTFVSSYPGTPSTEITEFAALYDEIYAEWAPNEKVAMEVAFGGSLSGKRSCCCMKHVGLNVAADPLFTMSYTGVNAGLVICVADDPGMHSSQNEQDSRHHAIASKIPMVEASDSMETIEFIKKAFEISEKYDTPVLFRTCTRIAHSQSIVTLGDRNAVEDKPYVKDMDKYIMMPAKAIKRHPIVEQRTLDLVTLAETDYINRVEKGTDNKIGIITAGSGYQYVKEVMGDKASVLKLGMLNPLPVELIKSFAASVERVIVVEELDPIIENHCKAIGVEVEGKNLFSLMGEFTQKTVAKALGVFDNRSVALDEAIPVRPPMMCAGCPHRGIYYTLAKNKCTVLGDIGCYTLGAQPPLCAMDMTLCMGASISGAHGFTKADPEKAKKTVAVIGDSTFMHSGMTGLVNVSYNASNTTTIILDNSITGITGHQQNPTTGYNLKGDVAAKVDLEALCHALGINRVKVVDPYDLKECDKVLKEELAAEEPSVIISRRPCVLLKYVKPQKALVVNKDKCKSCKACMKLGCPAISMHDGKAAIDATLCVGCDVCQQLCPFDAIEKAGE